MKRFKIDQFLLDNPGQPFPIFRKLGQADCAAALAQMKQRWGDQVIACQTPQDLALGIRQLARPILKIAEGREDGLLDMILAGNGIAGAGQVLINWQLLDNVDEMSFSDLNNHLSDIWYPGPDDIEIFPSTCDWVLCIDHEGYLTLLV